MSGLYAADGSFNISVVTGASYTGLYATDGSINVVQDQGSTYLGLYHPCGAWNVVVAPSPPGGRPNPLYGPNGDLYVSVSPYTNGGQRVTIVSGSFAGGGSTRYFSLLALTSN